MACSLVSVINKFCQCNLDLMGYPRARFKYLIQFLPNNFSLSSLFMANYSQIYKFENFCVNTAIAGNTILQFPDNQGYFFNCSRIQIQRTFIVVINQGRFLTIH